MSITLAAASELAKQLVPLLNLANSSRKLAESLRNSDGTHKELVRYFESRSGIAQAYPASLSPRLGARHIELVLLAFGQAFRHAWGDWDRFAPPLRSAGWRDRFLQGRDEAARQRQVEAALREALATPEPLPEDGAVTLTINILDDLLGTPLATPFYRRLWDAFTRPLLMLAESFPDPLLSLNSEQRDRFERDFRQAVEEVLATQTGHELRTAVLALAHDKTAEVRRLLLRDMANWGRRHVFGNVAHHQGLPAMPLDDLYVEPHATHATAKVGVRALVRRLLEDHRIVVVAADFGHGKSLTARSLARDWAQSWLTSSDRSLGTILPIFVKCAEDMKAGSLDLPQLVAKAQRRTTNALGISLKATDAACQLPEAKQRTVCLLDGLDEVVLSSTQVRELFDLLREEVTDEHRVVLFSRPASLPETAYLAKHDIPVVKLQPFDDQQIEDWLAGWNRLSLRPAVQLRDLGDLHSLAQTPILLFMIAHTWDGQAGQGPNSRGALYQQFIRKLALGKDDHDADEHVQIRDASEKLRDRLIELRWMKADKDRADAMIWLLARVAWQAHCLERQRPRQPLRTYNVQKILREELGLQDDSMERVVRVGLLLALQADPHDDGHEILFGHKSFREFLVARFWLNTLDALLAQQRSATDCEKLLMEGRLLGDAEDQSFAFLRQLIAQRPEADRRTLFQWAQQAFDREDLEGKSLRTDRWYLVREAALAIGSHCLDEIGITARDPLALRTLVASFWLAGDPMDIRAPFGDFTGANLHGAHLFGVHLEGANLEGASLEGVNLEGAHLERAYLSDAHLEGAHLEGAHLEEAHLQRTDLQDAHLDEAHLEGANLEGAYLRRSRLTWASLQGANLYAAHLQEAHLEGASLEGANLKGANLIDAHLEEAHLQGANLEEANLEGANLADAHLEGANLEGASLTDANLEGASLEGVKPQGVLNIAALLGPPAGD